LVIHTRVDGETVRVGSLDQGVAEKLVIGISRENHLTVVAALDDVLGLTGNNVTGKASHGEGGSETGTPSP
jgi:hypothetical protein